MSVEKTQEMALLLHCILCAKFSQILEVLRDFHHLLGSRNSPTTGILHTICHVYRSVWPAREAKPRFGDALEHSVHDCETHLLTLKKKWLKTCTQPLWYHSSDHSALIPEACIRFPKISKGSNFNPQTNCH